MSRKGFVNSYTVRDTICYLIYLSSPYQDVSLEPWIPLDQSGVDRPLDTYDCRESPKDVVTKGTDT